MPTQGLDNKISNIIGAKLPQWVMNQLVTRSNKNTQDSRDNDNLLYLANKTAWVRLVSSINIVDSQDLNYFKRIVGDSISSESDLAKQFVLFGGTSKYLGKNSYAQRSGLGKDGAYGILGTTEIQNYGYKPMPGVTSVNIETQGRLGSVRAATINFKCWDKSQLDIIDALYFKLGFTMFLEWGHTYFYPNPNNNKKLDPNKVQSTELYSIDPFEEGLNKEDILSKISKNSRDTDGNYDAMLGIVTNFNFTYSQDGGFDCTVRLMALGVLGDSIKINNAGILPDILKEEIIKLNNTLIEINKFLQQPPDTLTANLFPTPDPSNDLLSNLAVDLGLYLRGFAPQILFSDLSDAEKKSIAFANNNVDSERAKEELRSELFKNSRSIVIFPYSADFKVEDNEEYKKIDSKQFYKLDYAVDKSLRYYISGLKLILDKKQTYSEIQLDIPKLKERYIKSFPVKDNKSFYETVFATEKPGDPTWNGELVKGYSLAIGGIDKTKNYIYGVQYKNALGKQYYFNIILDLKFKFNQKGSLNSPGDVSIQDLRDINIDTTVNADTRKEILKQILGNGENTYGFENNLTFNKEYYNEAKGWPNFSYQFNLETQGKISVQVEDKNKRKINAVADVGVKIVFNDSDLFSNITTNNQDLQLTSFAQSIKQRDFYRQQDKTQFIDLGEQRLAQEASSVQISQAINLQSSLEIILRTIQIHALNEAINKFGLDIGKKVFVNNFYDDTTVQGKKSFLEQIFSNGVFGSFIKALVENDIKDFNYTTDGKMNPIERFKIQSKYGFATNLMANKAAISELQGRDVNFQELLRAFVVPYQINQEIIKGTQTNHPVYIPLGLLLMILNHTCTIYDTKGSFQTPLVYIDFNPELNFFLTNTKQLSTNPWKTLIPFEGSFQDYKQLFDSKILGSDGILPISGSTQKTPLFNPETQDVLSGQLPKIKFGSLENNTVYRGRLMNVLLNVDYLVSLTQQYSSKDTINNVYLKPFLEQLLADLNKFLGNFNAFRLSYNDAGNTFQLIDDQFIPSLSQEDQISANQNKLDITNRTEIPLVGKTSIAKSLEIKTEISSKLANMIAISANSTVSNKSTLSTNASNYGYINTNYIDRYIIDRREPTGSIVSKELDTAKISAGQFNQTISDFYSKINPSEATVSHATNYYIEKMSRIKNDEYPTRASAMIPVFLNFTTDGISGMSMGQAFTISDELLPYTYSTKKVVGLPTDHVNNIGFVMVGLIHTIENNSWNTAVRANMIFLKDKTEFKSEITRVEDRSGEFQVNINNQFTTTPFQETNFKGQSPDAKKAAENYLGRVMTDVEWSQLVAATFAEASDDQTERAWVMGVILNRARNNNKSITTVLTEKNQFQAVTGTSANGNRPSPRYVSGPDPNSAIAIYGAAISILFQVPTNYIFFTSNNPAAYGEGTDIGFLNILRSKPEAKIIGGTIFSITG